MATWVCTKASLANLPSGMPYVVRYRIKAVVLLTDAGLRRCAAPLLPLLLAPARPAPPRRAHDSTSLPQRPASRVDERLSPYDARCRCERTLFFLVQIADWHPRSAQLGTSMAFLLRNWLLCGIPTGRGKARDRATASPDRAHFSLDARLDAAAAQLTLQALPLTPQMTWSSWCPGMCGPAPHTTSW